MAPPVVPYGAWPSPLTAAAVARGGVAIYEVALDDGAVWWAEGRPAEQGRVALVRRDATGTAADVLPGDFNVRTRVHEYGGAAWVPTGDGGVVAGRFDDQRLYAVALPGAAPRALTPDTGGRVRYADLRPVPGGVLCVREDVGSATPRRALVTLAVDGRGDAVPLFEGPRFLAAPRPSPDGRRLAWLGWEHPQMPWDGTTLYVGDLAGATLTGVRRVAGGPTESLFQPAWAPDGSLYVVSDRTGWWNLYRVGADDRLAGVLPLAEECGWPHWVFGMASYAPLADGRIAVVHGRDDYALDLLDPATGRLSPLGLPFTAYHPVLAAAGTTVAAVAASPTTPFGVVTVDTATGRHSVVRSETDDPPDPAYLPVPRSVAVPSAGGRETHAHVYPPTSPAAAGPAAERPPYLLFVHGGPTAQSPVAYDPQVAFWTSRGIGVAVVNYGGSTGYGRAYRDLLRGSWGVVDVEDCVAVARWLVESGRTDADRVAIRGGSAGGFTVLAALTGTDAFAAGTSYYGVADLRALAEDTHDFESRYLDGLVGPLPDAADVYAERAPLSHVDGLSCPVLLLQGAEDLVVPPAQAEAFAAALRAKGLPFALLVFPGEQHGFRRAETVTRALAAELSFYGQVMGFDPPGVPRLDLER